MSSITDKILQTYQNNLNYINNSNSELYDKVILLGKAIELGIHKENFILEFKEDKYFDILNKISNNYIYNQDSNYYGKELAKNINFIPNEHTFRTFYNINTKKNTVSAYDNMDIYIHFQSCTASLFDYLNTEIPKKQTMNKINKFLFLGVGLGTHIEEIHKKIKSSFYFIAEENLELFRLSLFVTDYSKIAKTAKIYFSIAEDNKKFNFNFEYFFNFGFMHNHYLKFNLFSKNSEKYIPLIQSILSSQSHYSYPYNRTFLTINRILDLKDERFLNLGKSHTDIDSFCKPTILLASGPSAEYNIDWLKENQHKFIIVAIFASLKFCEKNGIKPDIIIQVDEFELATKTILLSIKSKDLFKDSVFIFSSVVDPLLIKEFSDSKKYFFQINRIKIYQDFGYATSSSIGEITYKILLLLGFNEIYLLGLDLALDPKTNKTHAEEHHATKELSTETNFTDKRFSYSKNTFKVKGNFINEVFTTSVFYSSIKSFESITNEVKKESQNVYNLNNGAFLEGANPKKAEEVEVNKFVTLNKSKLQKELISSFNNISRNTLNTKDINSMKDTIKKAYQFKNFIEIFSQRKSYTNIEQYTKDLSALITNLIKDAGVDPLSKVYRSYFNLTIHYVIYFFNLKEVNNHKRHIKKINRILIHQLNKIVNTYINSYEKYLEKNYPTYNSRLD